ncbi:semaphorin-4A-like isoform X2 [Hoplias malabaricus]|uniref:semaphorin-4A-like isoform X2 n=1 Tax=Hoplias malabaricus TaxID=27720 RepID=UPI0034623CA5
MRSSSLISVCLPFILITCGCHGNVTPRVTFPLHSPGRSVSVFSADDVFNTTTLLLSKDEDTLFIGARNAILSLSLSQGGGLTLSSKLDWSPPEKDLTDCSMKGKEEMDCPNFVRVLQVVNSTHLYACGTFAFSPRCTFISSEPFSLVSSPKAEEGRGRCPYDPYQKNTAITVDGELYTGTVADYRGNRPVISRHLSEGGHVDLKLDDTLGWLEEPTFISSAFIPSEEKVYFFFSETGREYDFIDKFTVSRIAQVCTSDVGGQRTLQRRWTTFTKAQLLCQSAGELPYNVLQDITSLQPPEGATEDQTLFYGIFSSQWSVNSGRSAVCVFSLKTIKDVFAGNYKFLNRDTLKWSTKVQEKPANPGECGLHNASDNTLRFVKENFLADQSVQPINQELTLVSPDHLYSNIAAQRVKGANGKEYTVLYLLTENGFLHKAVLLEKGTHIIEEIQVFTQPQRVRNLLLSIPKGVVLVGSSEGVLSVPVSNCSFYLSCADCVLARDPFCGWDRSKKTCAQISSITENAGQDVDNGDVSEVCKTPVINPRSRSMSLPTPAGCLPSELVSVSLNDVVRLPCSSTSRLARVHWEGPNGHISSNLSLQKEDGSISFLATASTLGCYKCLSVENGFSRVLAMYNVKQESSTTLQTPTHAPTTQTHTTPPVQTTRGFISPDTKLLTTAKRDRETQTNPMTKELQPTVSVQEPTVAVTRRKSSRNITPEQRLEVGGESQPLHREPTYLKELVVVSVLFALCLCALLTIILLNLRQRFRSRTAPHSPGGSPRTSSSNEREALRHSPSAAKRNGSVQNGSKPPHTLSNGALNGSNGHLPNTPI